MPNFQEKIQKMGNEKYQCSWTFNSGRGPVRIPDSCLIPDTKVWLPAISQQNNENTQTLRQ